MKLVYNYQKWQNIILVSKSKYTQIIFIASSKLIIILIIAYIFKQVVQILSQQDWIFILTLQAKATKLIRGPYVPILKFLR